MSGIPCLPPLDILDTAERLGWPCEPYECIEVITAMDDQWRDLNA